MWKNQPAATPSKKSFATPW